jgi:hypothetical protein
MAREERDGGVLSVRLSAKELATLREIATREGGRVSDVIRDALESYTALQRGATLEWQVPENSRVFMSRGGPSKSQSLNPDGTKETLKMNDAAMSGT